MRMSTAMHIFFYIIISINLRLYTAAQDPVFPTATRLKPHASLTSEASSEGGSPKLHSSEKDDPSITEADLIRNYTRQLPSSAQHTPDHSPRIDDSTPSTTPPTDSVLATMQAEADSKSAAIQKQMKDEQERHKKDRDKYEKKVNDRSEQLERLQITEAAEQILEERKKHLLSYAAKRATLIQKIEEEGSDPIATAILRSDTTRKWSSDFDSAPAFSPASSSSVSPASSTTSSAYSSAATSQSVTPKQSPSLGPVPVHGSPSGSPSHKPYKAPSPLKTSLWQSYKHKQQDKEKEKDKDKSKRTTFASAALASLSLSSPKNASPSSGKH